MLRRMQASVKMTTNWQLHVEKYFMAWKRWPFFLSASADRELGPHKAIAGYIL